MRPALSPPSQSSEMIRKIGYVALGLAIGCVLVGLFLAGRSASMAQRRTAGAQQWTAEAIDGAKAQADGVLKALNTYREAHKQYPPNLNALVPDTLPALPTPKLGRWTYTRRADGGIEFGFVAAGGHPSVIYTRDRGWVTHP